MQYHTFWQISTVSLELVLQEDWFIDNMHTSYFNYKKLQ